MGTRCADHVTPLYPQKLALTSPTGGGRSVGIVRSRTKATEYFFKYIYIYIYICIYIRINSISFDMDSFVVQINFLPLLHNKSVHMYSW